ncbi:hypothetical protein [Streptomyces sp. NPDC048419]|uniref:hypothetical protein n=1 Tax=Streptomyces sp. NPDC048419 TaxID=3365547 RepID=UPI00371111EA
MAQQEHRPSSVILPGSLRNAASALQKVPGAAAVSRAAGQALDRVGAVSPRGRRLAVYAGAGVLGVAGVVEWPVAVTGAAVAWLTQPRPERRKGVGDVIAPGGEGETPAATTSLGAEPKTGEAPLTPVGDTESGHSAKPGPDLLGGGGPLTESAEPTAPTDRTTG